jgi:tetratricopeptide (TPR) repeat protein
MRRIILAAALAVAVAAATAAALPAYAQMPGGPGGGPMGRPGAGGPPPDQSAPPQEDKPDVVSQKAYKLGAKALQKGKDHDAAAARAASPDKRAAEIEKASDEYYRALDLFTLALSGRPEMAEAWDSVGYAHLRLGAYRESIDDYDHALKYRPDLEEAVLNRALAYLNLDRLDDAEAAYMDLFNHERALADQLMAAMQKWLADHRQDAKGMRPAQIDAFDTWLQERDKIARQAVS